MEGHNVGTQAYGRKSIGSLKVAALTADIFRDTGIHLQTSSDKLADTNCRKLLKGHNVIVDCFDNSASRGLLQAYARTSKTPCLHVGLDADYAEICWDAGYRVPQDRPRADAPCDYPLARNIVMLAVVIASECLVEFAIDGTHRSFHATLRDRRVVPIPEFQRVAVGRRH